MSEQNPCAEVEYVVRNVGYPGQIAECKPFGNGHINDTFAVVCRADNGSETRYVLQRINHDIFKNPVQVMNNVVYITEFLREKLSAAGQDPERGTISYLRMAVRSAPTPIRPAYSRAERWQATSVPKRSPCKT